MSPETQQHLLIIKSIIDKAVYCGKIFKTADDVMQAITSYNALVSTLDNTSVTPKTE